MKKLGMNGWFFERIDYKQKDQLGKNKELEFLWNTINNISIFSHIIYYHYGEFKGLPQLAIMEQTFKDLAKNLTAEAEMYQFNEIVRLVGDDFAAYNTQDYLNIEKMIEFFNVNPEYGINMFFSTPQNYLAKIYELQQTNEFSMPYYSKDFFPYRDKENSYWSGYFGTKTNQKYLIRQTGKFYRNTATALTLINFMQSQNKTKEVQKKHQNVFNVLKELENEIALGNHHDTVTGTSAKYVDEAYQQSIQKIIKKTEKTLKNSLKDQFPDYFSEKNDINICKYEQNTSCIPQFKFSNGTQLLLFIFNPGDNRNEHISLKVPNVQLEIINEDNQGIYFELVCNSFEDDLCDLFIFSSFPALSFKPLIITVINSTAQDDFKAKNLKFPKKGSQTFKLFGVQAFQIFPSGEDFVQTILNSETINKFSLNYKYYESYINDESGNNQLSGAYIMRLKDYIQNPLLYYEYLTIFFRVSKIEGIQYYNGSNIFLLIIKRRLILTKIILSLNSQQIEILTSFKSEYFHDSGREYIMQLKSPNFNNNDRFYTDSIGLMGEERILEGLNPAKNFYPATVFAYIQDNQTKQQMNVLLDRGQGVSSLQKGELEFMFAREVRTNDYRGLTDSIFRLEEMHLKHVLVFTNSSENFQLRSKQLRSDQPLLPMLTIYNGVQKNPLLLKNEEIQTSQSLLKFVFQLVNDKELQLYIHNMDEINSYYLPIDFQTNTIENKLQSWLNQSQVKIQKIDECDLSFTELIREDNGLNWNGIPESYNQKKIIDPMDIRAFKIILQ